MVLLCLGQRRGIVWDFARHITDIRQLKVTNLLGPQINAEICPQSDAIFPSRNVEVWKELDKVFNNPDFNPKAAELLGGAVRVPTESYDVMDPVGQDPRWEPFGILNDYLETTFPLVNSTLRRTKVNGYALIYEWDGSDPNLKPLLLTAHQDVVPVEPITVGQWTHPPYSGYYDGKFVWGRGSLDDKSGLIAVMIAVESLLESGFKPTRKVVLAFGIDEEATGHYGAKLLGEHMVEKFGRDAFAMLVDEGGGLTTAYGGKLAAPGVAEKGYLDVMVEVNSPGGHSSRPPTHTSIGMLASFVVRLEQNPFPYSLTRATPLYSTLQCVAEHSPELDSSLREVIKKSISSDRALKQLQDFVADDPLMRSLITTTQAIDLIGGGVKVNALPEQAWAVINHRIAAESSVKAVQQHDTSVLENLASEFNLSFTAFGRDVNVHHGPAYGALIISEAFNSSLEPAPITPTGPDAAPYRVLSGTIKATYETGRHNDNGGQLTVAPFMGGGNTDTQFYWNLTQHIFRYDHVNVGEDGDARGAHTVNEAMNIDSFIEMTRFFVTLILNVDESDAI
ncbi:carboxypeptidase S [Schizopora paradoxa]|uniref:Carboxypeptidase S n=1 Tax=Schizopora paradoxa TaxID=27342 RepID=A0A0H2RI08_9AGAM|nr:carboxypeptidase S [Schizopora paradoxa]